MHYITMVFDIKNSRKIKNRELIQNELITTIKLCNEQFNDIIASPFLIILGDEWQGLLKAHSDYKKVIAFFKEHLPEEILFYTGIGIGEIAINNLELTVNQLDGPSFYLAREAITYAKKKNHMLVVLEN